MTDYIYLKGPLDAILHFAVPASPVDYLELPIQTLKVGCLGTHNALGLAIGKGRALPAGLAPAKSTATRWSTRSPRPTGATSTRSAPRGVYDEAKRFAEAMTMAYHRIHGVRHAHRPHLQHLWPAHAPGRWPRRAQLHWPGAARRAAHRLRRRQQTRSFCYVSDLVDGIYRLLLSEEHDPVNIGNPTELTIGQFAEVINRLTGNPAGIRFEPLPVDDPQQRQPDITKAHRLLGWEPGVGLDEGMARTIEWFAARLNAS